MFIHQPEKVEAWHKVSNILSGSYIEKASLLMICGFLALSGTNINHAFAMLPFNVVDHRAHPSSGAIAYSKSSGNSGYSYGYGDQQSAINRAIRSCNAPDCKIVVTFDNGCGALAKGSTNGTGWATAPSRQEAEARALMECERVDRSCRIICWACSRR